MSIEPIIALKRDLKNNIIFPRGFLKEILMAHAGQTIIINDPGQQIRCRVNRQGCLLVNSELKELLEMLGGDSFILFPDLTLPADAGYFTLKKNSAAPEPRQIDLSALIGNLLDLSSPPADTIPAKKHAEPGPARKEKPMPPKAASAKHVTDKVKMPPDEARKTRGSFNFAPLNTPDKVKTSPNKAVISFISKAASPPPEETFSPPEKTTSVPEPNASRLPKTVLIHFSSEADEKILATAEEGKADPPTDLALHLNALFLSLSPGFDTLLSLSAVRRVEVLDYQLATVRRVLKNLRGRALLCDEVGLGKTIEAGLIMMEYLLRGLVRRVLVLTPPSLVEQWHQEMQTKFNLTFITYDQPEFKSHPNPWGHFEHIIASLDTAKHKQNQKQVLAADYDLVIVDEAHHLKNHRTQAYQMVQRLRKKYILLLTATPVENNLQELFNLITLLLPGQLETAASFKRKYITRGNPLKPKNTEDLKKLVREVMIRNRRSETGVIQVKRRAEVVEVSLTAEELEFYHRLTAFVRLHYTNKSGSPGSSINQFILKLLQREAGSSSEAALATLEKMANGEKLLPDEQQELTLLIGYARQISRGAKAEALLKLLNRIPEKVIVFTSFRETQRRLVSFLRENGLDVAELHGGMLRRQKEEQVGIFAEEGRVLISTDVGSEGRNLQFCRYVINFDLPWNPMRIEQRVGRLHRMGQKEDVFILNFAAKQTVEAHVLELLDAKINMFQLVVGELDIILGSLKEKKDFESIIMDIWSEADSEEKLAREIGMLGERLIEAKQKYEAVRQLDDRLLGELLPFEE